MQEKEFTREELNQKIVEAIDALKKNLLAEFMLIPMNVWEAYQKEMNSYLSAKRVSLDELDNKIADASKELGIKT